MQRVLSVSLSHVLRSAVLLLTPIALLALLAWATAGSASGNTTDPIRGALWIWLGMHHVPFSLNTSNTAGLLTYLPLGALVLPVLVVRSTFNRALERLQGDFQSLVMVRLIFSTQYAIVLTLLALLGKSASVAPQWYFAPLFAFLIAFGTVSTCGLRIKFTQQVIFATRIIALIVGASFIAYSILIFTHLSQFKNIFTVLQAGLFGGLLLLILNLLYLPNAVLATTSYFAGTGFAIGKGTLVSPLWYHLDQLPALPLLAATPSARHPLALFAILLFIATGVLLAIWTERAGIQVVLQSYLLIIIAFVGLAYFASGSLITSAMGAVGISIWKFAIAIAVEIGIGIGATILIKSKLHR